MEELIHIVTRATTREEFVLLVFGAAGGLALMSGLFGAWIGAYFGGRRGARRGLARLQDDPASARVEAELGELRHAIETMAVEMERISEGQRFTARMLVERAGNPAPVGHRRDGGISTPH